MSPSARTPSTGRRPQQLTEEQTQQLCNSQNRIASFATQMFGGMCQSESELRKNGMEIFQEFLQREDRVQDHVATSDPQPYTGTRVHGPSVAVARLAPNEYLDDDDEGLFGTGIPRGATGLGPVLGGSNTDTSTTVPSESTSSGSPAAAASQQGLPLAAAASQSQSNLV